MTIQGPAAGQTIDGGNNSRIFAVPQTGTALILENLTLQNGHTIAARVGDCTGGEGGAVCALSDLTLTNSTVSGNSTAGGSAYGGGLYVNGNTTLTNSTVSGNSTAGDYADGGGLYVAGGNTTLTNSTVSGNSTTGNGADGGGLHVSNGNTTLSNSTVSGNSTTGNGARGGGLYVNGNATLTNSTVSGNSTAGNFAGGGGLYVAGGNTTLTNSTVVNNSIAVPSTYTAGIAQYGNTLTLTSTIVAGNRDAGVLDDCGLANGATLNASSSYNLIESTAASACGLVNDANNKVGVAPDLGALADNGCATSAGNPATAACVQTHLPNEGSPAIDTGSNSLALATDQRGTGFPRVVGAAADIGAVEGVAAVTAVPTLAPWGLGLLLSLLGWLGTRAVGSARRR